ncbi:hypothetical protein EJ02DRAFT_333906 [Clathrospora elynae]|uniref:Uncharacterized protein n=1 Tax=Clathrospora elynae TaxID=706981 RepID=A0A6A5T5H8_9PLEO|nr:hypothetical protein EJ02DRAFT_333906 [Clathrospora elynae]
MIDAPPQSPSRPARLRNPSHSAPSATTPSQPQMHAAQADPAFSLLLSLPRELRDRIYTFALTSPYPFWWPGKAPPEVVHDVSVNLVRANRQVYEESVAILYGDNKFLFTHPSDCTVFRVVASPASINITSVYFRIREKDVRLWTTYVGSKIKERSLRADLPKLRSLWVFLRCGGVGVPGAVQNVLGQQMQALQQQVQSLTQVMANAGAHIVGGGGGNVTGHAQAGGNQIPPPPPPAPAMPFIQFAQGALGLGGHGHHHPAPAVPHPHGTQNNPPNPSPLAQHLAHTQHQQHNLPLPPFTGLVYSSFLRFEREMGIESLCLNLHDVLHPLPSPSTSSGGRTEASRSTSSERSDGTRSSTPNTMERSKPATEVKIVCIMRIPREEVKRLARLYPDELNVDWKTSDARTRFRKLHGVEVSLELSGYPSFE